MFVRVRNRHKFYSEDYTKERHERVRHNHIKWSLNLLWTKSQRCEWKTEASEGMSELEMEQKTQGQKSPIAENPQRGKHPNTKYFSSFENQTQSLRMATCESEDHGWVLCIKIYILS